MIKFVPKDYLQEFQFDAKKCTASEHFTNVFRLIHLYVPKLFYKDIWFVQFVYQSSFMKTSDLCCYIYFLTIFIDAGMKILPQIYVDTSNAFSTT